MVSRIQRSRERGSRQPPNTKYCGRPSEWANPFRIGDEYTRDEAIEAFREAFWGNELPVTPVRARSELAAYDYLSCWCRLDQFCHVDEYIRAISCEHKLRDADDATAWSAVRACTGPSPSRAHRLPARTAASHSLAGERRERRTAGCEHSRARIPLTCRATQAPSRPWCIVPASAGSSSDRASAPPAAERPAGSS